MKINKIDIENFHGFENASFNLDDNFTLFVGENATGKTSILDALAVAIGGFILGIDGIDSRNILPNEVRRKQIEQGKIINLEKQYPVKISAIGFCDDKQIKWERSLNSEKGRTTRTNAKEIIDIAKSKNDMVKKDEECILPVFSYHGTGRLWARTVDTDEDSIFETGSRTLGYKRCLSPASNEKFLKKWLKKMTLVEIQEEIEIYQFRAVKRAIEDFISNVSLDNEIIGKSKVTYSINSDELMITLENGKRLPFNLLSDGYRNVIGMVADIAFRMAVLNPHLEKDAIKKTPGIVLIDEIDLHLHPQWQRKIVSDFKRVFPNIQFVATTHSPFIIQSLDKGELRNLDKQNIEDKFSQYNSMSVEDITEDIMGVDMPQWSERKNKMYEASKKYFEALEKFKDADDKEVIKLKEEMDKLTKPFTDDIAFVAFLEHKRAVEEAKINREIK
ncbi:MAG: AAA family ATPase [Peptostreptococcaceae bacterium]